MKFVLTFLLMAGFGLASAQQNSIEGNWLLTYVQMGQSKPEFNPFYVRNGIEIRMKDDGKVGVFEAHDMCNRAMGKYTLTGPGKLIITELGVTERACTMDWPTNFWQNFRKNTSYKLVGDNLYIFFEDDKNLYAFERNDENPESSEEAK